jgi:predicted amidohydrolase YtcJ
VECVAIRGRDVLAVGDLETLREVLPDAEFVDLAGGTLLPGLIDAHNHFLSTGESLVGWDLRYPRVDSPAALLGVVREAAAAAAPGETLHGLGFDNGKYPLPSLAELDEASGDHPLQFAHTSGHNVLVNSVVFARFGVDTSTPDPPGGRFVRDDNGQLTGLCLDAASSMVVPTDIDIGSHGPKLPHQCLARHLGRRCRSCWPVVPSGRTHLRGGRSGDLT